MGVLKPLSAAFAAATEALHKESRRSLVDLSESDEPLTLSVDETKAAREIEAHAAPSKPAHA